MMKIKRALISVSNKTGVVEFARTLHKAGIEIVSTGGTMKALHEAGIPVIYVSDVTGFPEIMVEFWLCVEIRRMKRLCVN